VLFIYLFFFPCSRRDAPTATTRHSTVLFIYVFYTCRSRRDAPTATTRHSTVLACDMRMCVREYYVCVLVLVCVCVRTHTCMLFTGKASLNPRV
jgi:hypothetical protein